MAYTVAKTNISDLLIGVLKVFCDSGVFCFESFLAKDFAQAT